MLICHLIKWHLKPWIVGCWLSFVLPVPRCVDIHFRLCLLFYMWPLHPLERQTVSPARDVSSRVLTLVSTVVLTHCWVALFLNTSVSLFTDGQDTLLDLISACKVFLGSWTNDNTVRIPKIYSAVWEERTFWVAWQARGYEFDPWSQKKKPQGKQTN